MYVGTVCVAFRVTVTVTVKDQNHIRIIMHLLYTLCRYKTPSSIYILNLRPSMIVANVSCSLDIHVVPNYLYLLSIRVILYCVFTDKEATFFLSLFFFGLPVRGTLYGLGSLRALIKPTIIDTTSDIRALKKASLFLQPGPSAHMDINVRNTHITPCKQPTAQRPSRPVPELN